MAFPTIAGTPVNTEDGVNTTTHTVDLPTGITAGEKLLFVVFSKNQITDNPVTFDTLTETQLAFARAPATPAQTALYIYVADATGSEGATTGITLGTTSRCVVRAMRIAGAQSLEATALHEGNTLTPDPPSHTASYGAKDTKWLVFACNNNGTFLATDWPDNYTNTGSFTTNGSGPPTIAWGERDLNTATENPNAFGFDNTTPSASATLAIRPLESVETLRPTGTSGLTNLTGTVETEDPDGTITQAGLSGTDPSGTPTEHHNSARC